MTSGEKLPARAAIDGVSCTVLLLTRVETTRSTLISVLRSVGDRYTEPVWGYFEVQTASAAEVIKVVARNVTSLEALEVRAVVLDGEQGPELLAAAMAAPTLSRMTAEVKDLDLMALFAAEQTSFRCDYQPIVALDGDTEPTVIGYEALLRATSGEPPKALFAAAERAGWSHVLDRIGRTTALRDAAGWLGESFLFVNLLPATINRPESWFDSTALAAEQAGIRVDQLVFELTEGELVNDLDHLAEVFAFFRERGCRIALDDLGAGYSSLNLLVRLEPDIVKLDKQLVDRLSENAGRAVVSAVVDIAHGYGGLVLAEGVETAAQAAAIRELGVDLGQGWFYGHPENRTGCPSEANSRRSSDVIATSDLNFGRADVEALFRRAINGTATGVTIVDAQLPDMPIIFVNESFRHLTGFLESEVLGKNCRFLQGPDTDREAVRLISAALGDEKDHVNLLLNYRKDGTAWWNELRLSPVRDGAGTLTHYFGFQSDVTARVEAEREVARLATHDQLTGLPNRSGFYAGLNRHLADATRSGGQVAVLFIDLDGFKDVNDSLGHEVGDRVLAAVAERVRQSLRAGCLLARLSGDEFVVSIPDVEASTGEDVARLVSADVLDAFRAAYDLDEHEITIGASVGVALFPHHGRTGAELIRAADKAMYAAKNAGRGRAALAMPPTPTSP